MAAPGDRPDTWQAEYPEIRSGRCHGTLMRITDSERRALRSISTTAHEAAHRTGTLLADLLAIPGLRIFQGVASAVVGVPPIPHAIRAGRQGMLVESVPCPSGRSATPAIGRLLW